MRRISLSILIILSLFSCENQTKDQVVDYNTSIPFIWENANVYFLLTDRFKDGNINNNLNFDRTLPTAPERGFQGGDFAGIIEKIDEGYFNKLGVNVLWFSPVVEQIHGGVDEGTGFTYAYHGYWAKDWTNIEPNFGTEEEFEILVNKAHKHGIRIMMDVVINHTGPVTDIDPYWGEEWARTSPKCEHDSYESTVYCTLVENLPDIKTESNKEVKLPPFLLEKWVAEGSLEENLTSLEKFFKETGYTQSPRFFIIKWLIDFIRKYGIDGFRIDTAKHTEASIWAELAKEAKAAFAEWKVANPELVLDDNDFYLSGEVYNYGISSGQIFDNGGTEVNYFNEGALNSLINFEFKWDAKQLSYSDLFTKYDSILQNELSGYSILNYITSHDDGTPFDKERLRAIEGATKLILCPGKCQIYYGDESSRNLIIENTMGDATLRGFMNWEEIELNTSRSGFEVIDVLTHYQKLGQFRANNPSVGAGKHTEFSSSPLIFSRSYEGNGIENKVVIALDYKEKSKSISVNNVFADETILRDYYSNIEVVVENGKVLLESNFDIVLLGL